MESKIMSFCDPDPFVEGSTQPLSYVPNQNLTTSYALKNTFRARLTVRFWAYFNNPCDW
jgi:hypothetical protein